MEHANRGATALEASDALSAVAHYTKALIEHPTSPDYFTQRSTAFTRLRPPRHDLALQDAEYAVVLAQRRQKREKIQAAQQRRVVSLYGLGQYEQSKQILDSMLRWRPKDSKKEKMEHDMWMARITSKLNNKAAEDQNSESVREYPVIDLPNEKEIKTRLQHQLMPDGSFTFNNSDPAVKESSSGVTPNSRGSTVELDLKDVAAVEATKVEATTAPAIAQQQASKAQPVRHDWYQDIGSVTITFYAKKVDKAKLQSTFEDDHVQISFPHPEAPTEIFSFTLDPTFGSIDTSTSTAKATGAKVELKLIKKEKGIKWAALDNKDRPKVDKLPSAWTTKGEQDWDKKAAEITKKEPKKKGKNKESEQDASEADSDTGGDAVDGFFKKLYAGADDDTRRAMMKSFQESNGTALSTNWQEVGKGKVEEVKSKDS